MPISCFLQRPLLDIVIETGRNLQARQQYGIVVEPRSEVVHAFPIVHGGLLDDELLQLLKYLWRAGCPSRNTGNGIHRDIEPLQSV